MNISQPYLGFTNSSNGAIKLAVMNNTLVRVSFVAQNPIMALTITIKDLTGSVINDTSRVYTSGIEADLSNIPISEIDFSDVNSYNIDYTIQYISNLSQSELISLETTAKIRIVPIDNVDIVSPLDSTNSRIMTINQPNKSVLVNNTALTTTTSYTYTAVTDKLGLTAHITAVSGTSPSIVYSINAVDDEGNILSGDPLYTSPSITAIGDTVIYLQLYGYRKVDITATITGTSPSFKQTLEVFG